jgi:hypothetical protein
MSDMDCVFSISKLYIFSELWNYGALQDRSFSAALQPQRDCPLSIPTFSVVVTL